MKYEEPTSLCCLISMLFIMILQIALYSGLIGIIIYLIWRLINKFLQRRTMKKEKKFEKGEMTLSEAGRRGGNTTFKKYGQEHYEKIGRKGGQTVKRLVNEGKKIKEES